MGGLSLNEMESDIIHKIIAAVLCDLPMRPTPEERASAVRALLLLAADAYAATFELKGDRVDAGRADGMATAAKQAMDQWLRDHDCF